MLRSWILFCILLKLFQASSYLKISHIKTTLIESFAQCSQAHKRPFFPSFLPSFLPSFHSSFLHLCIPWFMHVFLPFFIHFFISSIIPSFLLVFLYSVLPSFFLSFLFSFVFLWFCDINDFQTCMIKAYTF